MVLGFKCSDLSYLFSEVTALVLYTLFHTKWEVQYISDWEGRLTCNLYACWWSYNTTYVSKRVFILTMQYQAGLHRISFTRIYFSHQIKFTYLNFTKSEVWLFERRNFSENVNIPRHFNWILFTYCASVSLFFLILVMKVSTREIRDLHSYAQSNLLCKFCIDTDMLPSALGFLVVRHICSEKYSLYFSTRPDQIIHSE